MYLLSDTFFVVGTTSRKQCGVLRAIGRVRLLRCCPFHAELFKVALHAFLGRRRVVPKLVKVGVGGDDLEGLDKSIVHVVRWNTNIPLLPTSKGPILCRQMDCIEYHGNQRCFRRVREERSQEKEEISVDSMSKAPSSFVHINFVWSRDEIVHFPNQR